MKNTDTQFEKMEFEIQELRTRLRALEEFVSLPKKSRGYGFADRAYDLACSYHYLEVDKAGVSYIKHLERVANRLHTDEEKTVAWLHDIRENCDITEKELRALFPAHICDAIEALTHNKGESRVEYYHRIKACGDLAVRVKLADIADNSNEQRLSYLSQSDQVRLREKYRKAKEILQSE